MIINDDCHGVMELMDGNSVDAIVTDPPYSLNFMGKAWDRSGIANNVAMWREALRVLKPGGHMLAFGGTRTSHRMVCAIEDAGFEIRDCLMWIYGSGFPKSHNGEWGGTALKPAHEPIVLCRKPLIGTIAANVLAHGTGALNIDDCRIKGESPSVARREASRRTGKSPGRPGEYKDTIEDRTSPERYTQERPGEALGRWPANVLHDGSDEVLAAFPSSASPWIGNPRSGAKGGKMFGGSIQSITEKPEYRDKGSAARFFYCAKASKRDRGENNVHPTVKPTDLMRYLCRLVTPPGGLVLDLFCGSGSTGKAAALEGFRFIGIEQDAHYAEIARRRIGEFDEPDDGLDF